MKNGVFSSDLTCPITSPLPYIPSFIPLAPAKASPVRDTGSDEPKKGTSCNKCESVDACLCFHRIVPLLYSYALCFVFMMLWYMLKTSSLFHCSVLKGVILHSTGMQIMEQ